MIAFVCLIFFVGVVSSYSFFTPKINAVCDNSFLYQQKPPNSIESNNYRLTLSTSHSSEVFVKKFLGSSLSGVYTVADDQENVKYVGISSVYSNDVKSTRVQTFAIANLPAMEAFRSELFRKVGIPQRQDDAAFRRILETEGSEFFSADVQPTESSPAIADKQTPRKRLKDVIQSSKASNPTQPMQSPFISEANMSSTNKNPTVPSKPLVGLGNSLEFNRENVDKVLDEVRPYLIADGGNVAVLEVDENTRDVKLLLQGACGSCPSSTTTMKMGIERVLKENFANLGSVISVDPAVTEKKEEEKLTIEMVQSSLERVLPAVKAMGGAVEVIAVDDNTGLVKLAYKGPAKLKQGVELVVKDNKLVKMIEISDL
eukprot:gene4423-8807_t